MSRFFENSAIAPASHRNLPGIVAGKAFVDCLFSRRGDFGKVLKFADFRGQCLAFAFKA